MGNSRSLVRRWWQDPADYQGLIRTLTSASALPLVRGIVALGGAVLCAVTILTLLSSAGPSDVFGRIVFVLVATLAAAWSLRWWRPPWPSARESLVWLAAADIAITAACLLDRDRVYGTVGATLLVVTGAYICIFHCSKALAAHSAWSLLSILLLTARLKSGTPIDDTPLALAIVLIMSAATVLILPTLHFCYWLLRMDTLSDPLTGLLNRRGLHYYLPGLAAAAHSGDIVAISIDLDRFKAVNDRFGHTVGDRALVRTAAQLEAAQPDFLVARTGGEEFTLVGRIPTATASHAAESLRQAIAAITDLPVPITASVGATTLSPASLRCEYASQILDTALHRSDAAMYQAKQSGGNTVVLTTPHQSPR
ncbi:GGDEF domain-containing protein [Nocardia yunnanensis]|uniref:GGDEF domain-containing protein n=1 Tax=Nocardia yunnanensis TaxID=2382165 RepID=A0A386ZLJ0_9NOCA|nr:GGDEF domain-containing protein [Nocardia yunnanensis]AYF78298.1 GGDEF domain-containing protein [Nocardia yunnanensis]